MNDWQTNTNPDSKRKRIGKSIEVEDALVRCFSHARNLNIPVSGPLLMEKGNIFGETFGIPNFHATVGGLERWKQRNDIKFKNLHGEKQDADADGADRGVKNVLPNILKDYNPRDIYNANDTGLYWRAIPNDTLIFKNI